MNSQETLDEVKSAEKDPEKRNEKYIFGDEQDEIDEKEAQDYCDENPK